MNDVLRVFALLFYLAVGCTAQSGRSRSGLLSKFRSKSAATKANRLTDPSRSEDQRISFSLIKLEKGKMFDRPRGLPALPENSPRVQELLFQIQAKSAAKVGHTAAGRTASPMALLSDSLAGASQVDDDGTEIVHNYDILPMTFEGDVVLKEEQALAILSGVEERRRFKRKMIGSSSYRWPTTVPVRYSGPSGGRWRSAVNAGIQQWSSQTCLRFVERSSQRDYVDLVVGQGCYSNVGRVGGAQQLSIGTGCDVPGIVAHEIGHALGYWHEQSRPDRDAFVDVRFDNILRGTSGNFEKRSRRDSVDFGNPYDYGSVMHYGGRAFARRFGLTTVETKDPAYQQTIGQRNGLSFIDVKIVNDAYCGDVCRGSGTRCVNGGYPDPKDCARCRCPDGLAGDCDRPQTDSSRCGGELEASSSWKTLSSSQSGAQCSWIIRAPSGGKVIMELSSVGYRQIFQDSCTSYVEVKYKRSFDQTGARFCRSAPRNSIRSASDMAVVVHKADRSAPGSFALRYRSEGGSARARATTPRPTRPAPTGFPFVPQTRRPPPPPTRTTPKPTTSSGGWTEWSSCTRSCGGCGKRVRFLRDPSLGVIRQTGRCGVKACPLPEGERCTVTLRIPCRLLERLSRRSFDPGNARFRVGDLPADFPPTRVQMIPRPSDSAAGVQRQTGTCRRKFTYPCSGRESSAAESRCCDGFAFTRRGFCRRQ